MGWRLLQNGRRLRAADVRRRLFGASASEDGCSARAAGSVAELIKKRGRENEGSAWIQPVACSSSMVRPTPRSQAFWKTVNQMPPSKKYGIVGEVMGGWLRKA